MGCRPFPTLRPLSFRLGGPLSFAGPVMSATSSPRMLFGATYGLSLADLARGRLRLDRLSRKGAGETFLPWASPIPRETRKSHRRHPPLRSGPRAGASSIASGLQIAIEAAMVAGSKAARRSDMANIGSFKKSGEEFQGAIVTLSVQTKGVRIVPESNRANDNAPSHRVYVGRAEIGAAWSKRSNEGRDYLSVKLDDPSFNAPIYAQPLRRRR